VTAAPGRFVDHLREHGYHPRSNAHGKALCEFVLADLLTSCPKIAEHAAQGKLVYDLNRKVIIGASEWNIDLVLGPPPGGFRSTPTPAGIPQSPPTTIRIAIEAKTVMTEHGKARRNRQRDLDSFRQFVHRYDPEAVAAALTIVNIAQRFKSPLRPEVSIHRNIEALVRETVALLRALPTRSAPGDLAGLEANGAILVDHDNVNSKRTRLVTTAPAPQVGDPLHYDSFLRRICDRYTQRWS
jgi:hypothetical protein